MQKHIFVILLMSVGLLVFPLYAQRAAAIDSPLPLALATYPPGPVPQDCGSVPGSPPNVVELRCAPPYQTPPYTQPADDSVVFGALLQASGFPGAQGASWVGVAGGNFCGTAQRQLIVASNVTSQFSLLEGPAPYGIGNVAETPRAASESAASWRAIAAGRFSADASSDDLIAARRIMSHGELDLVVMSVATSSAAPSCGTAAQVIASGTVSPDGNSDWLGVVAGNFDGTGEKIAMLRAAAPNLFLVGLSSQSVRVLQSVNLDGNGEPASRWKAIAAGDIDGDGIDELIVARQVSDGVSPTVIAYKWDSASSTFKVFATSGIGNDGNSNWASASSGDFNADGRKAVVLVQNQAPDFVLLDWPASAYNPVTVNRFPPPGPAQLRTLATASLDSASGQNWTGLTTTDWIGGDRGAAELIAVRAVARPYRTNVFVYGNPFLRIPRDTAMLGVKSQWVQHLTVYSSTTNPKNSFVPYTPTVTDLKSWLRATHTNTFNWLLQYTEGPPDNPYLVSDYPGLVNFLAQTQNWGVDGKQLRVWVTLLPPKDSTGNGAPAFQCSLPEDTRPLTSWNALDYFKQDFKHDYAHLTRADKISACRDMLAWASVIGRLAQDYPQLVGLGIDDFSDGLDHSAHAADCTTEFQSYQLINESCIAQIESRLQSAAAWLNFVPTIYYDYFKNRAGTFNWADLAPTLDSFLYYFRNEKISQCIDQTAECENTVNNAPGEIRDMSTLLPTGRKLQVGMYFVGCGECSEKAALPDRFTPPAIRYDYDLAHFALNMPSVGGVTAYGLQTPPWVLHNSYYVPCSDAAGATPCVIPSCNESNFLSSDYPGASPVPYGVNGTDRFCAIAEAYGEAAVQVQDFDVTQMICNSLEQCPPAAATGANPFGYISAQPAVPVNAARARNAVATNSGSPTTNVRNAILRTADGHVHRFAWALGVLRDDDLSGAAGSPNAIEDPKAYWVSAQSLQNAVYLGADYDVHRLFWTEPPATHEDLTVQARSFNPLNVAPGVSNAIGYSVAQQNVQSVIFKGNDGFLHRFWFPAEGPVHNDLLNQLASSPSPLGGASAYLSNVTAVSAGQNVLYTAESGHLYRLSWTTGAVTAEDLNLRSGISKGPAGPVAAYYAANPAAPWHHIFFRTADHPLTYNETGGTVYELWGPDDPIYSHELSGGPVNGPQANSNPSAYFVDSDGTNHVFYNYMGYVHEIWWQGGAVGANHEILTAFSGAPLAVSDPSAYYDSSSNTNHVVYVTADGHVHDLQR